MAENWFEKGTEKEGKPSKGLREKQRRGAVGKGSLVGSLKRRRKRERLQESRGRVFREVWKKKSLQKVEREITEKEGRERAGE